MLQMQVELVTLPEQLVLWMQVGCDSVFKRHSVMNASEAYYHIRTAGVMDTGQSH